MTEGKITISKTISVGKQIAAAIFWISLFAWLLLMLWDPDFKVSELHLTLQWAITGLLVWMLALLIESALPRPPADPPKPLESTSGYAYPYGKTRVTLNYIILFTVVFLALTILGLSDHVNSSSFKSLPWLGFFTQGNREVLLVTVAAGLGSSLATILAFIQHGIYEQDFEDRFMPWYLLRPMMGAILGVIFYFLIEGGLLALTNVSEENAAQGLDLYTLAGMATLVGFFSRPAIDKLKDIFDAMFSSTDNKVAVSKAEAKKALLTARNATYSILKAEIEAGGNSDELKTLEAVWKRTSDEQWTIGSEDEAVMMAALKEKLKSKMTDTEKKILGF